MAFPWIFEANFERGDNSDWDSETDTAAQLDFPHYSELARFPWPTATPYSGAYCMRVALTGGTADAFVLEGDINIAANATRYIKFDMWLSPDFTGTADDTINLFELQDTNNVIEGTFGLRYVNSTNVINFGIGEVTPTSFTTNDMPLGVWYTIEIMALNDPGANDGTLDLFITRAGDPAQTTVSVTQVASLDQGAVTHGVLGVQLHLATTTGTILYDNFIMDDARVFPLPRFSKTPILTQSGHAFIGPGHVSGGQLLTTGASNVMRLWDTDVADIVSTQNFVAEMDLDSGNFTAVTGPLKFERGCYVELSGTDPRGQVYFNQNSPEPGVLGPRYHSDAGVRRWGMARGGV